MQIQGVPVEEFYTLKEAAKKLPGRHPGKRTSLATVERWTRKGLKKGVRLRTILCGGQRCTCDTWLGEFLESLNAVAETGQAEPRLRTPQQRQRASVEAREWLANVWGEVREERRAA